jgi:hypothetical protein
MLVLILVSMIRFDVPTQLSWCEKQGTTELRICAPQPALTACKVVVADHAPTYDLTCLEARTHVKPKAARGTLPTPPQHVRMVPPKE